MTITTNGGESTEQKYVSLQDAIKFINENGGFNVKTRATFAKLEEKYSLPYEIVHTGSRRPRRRYSKKGLEDFVQNPQKYLILNDQGLYAYLTQHGFPVENAEDFKNLQRYYKIPSVIRDPNKPEEQIYIIKLLEHFVQNPVKYAIKRRNIPHPEDEIE